MGLNILKYIKHAQHPIMVHGPLQPETSTWSGSVPTVRNSNPSITRENHSFADFTFSLLKLGFSRPHLLPFNG